MELVLCAERVTGVCDNGLTKRSGARSSHQLVSHEVGRLRLGSNRPGKHFKCGRLHACYYWPHASTPLTAPKGATLHPAYYVDEHREPSQAAAGVIPNRFLLLPHTNDMLFLGVPLVHSSFRPLSCGPDVTQEAPAFSICREEVVLCWKLPHAPGAVESPFTPGASSSTSESRAPIRSSMPPLLMTLLP